ncbi:MAG: DNA-deoxyinosine glycosylase [Sphingobium sp.]
MDSGDAVAVPANWKGGLSAIAALDTRLLILGSLPGDKSLAQSQYYAHPRNNFWDLIGTVIAVPIKTRPYPERLTVLREHKIGLWDVIANAERKGSLDAAMRNVAANPLAEFVASLPDLRAIGFNGRTAFALGIIALGTIKGVSLIPLPSSSPAHAVGLERKLAEWMILRDYL